jgi:hypothetical protein
MEKKNLKTYYVSLVLEFNELLSERHQVNIFLRLLLSLKQVPVAFLIGVGKPVPAHIMPASMAGPYSLYTISHVPFCLNN